MVGWIDRWMVEWMNEWMNKWMKVYKDGSIDRCVNG